MRILPAEDDPLLGVRFGERFFRVLGSGASGSGLGWSIVRRVAFAQQALVRIGQSSRLGGLVVSIEWAAG